MTLISLNKSIRSRWTSASRVAERLGSIRLTTFLQNSGLKSIATCGYTIQRTYFDEENMYLESMSEEGSVKTRASLKLSTLFQMSRLESGSLMSLILNASPITS